MAKFIIELDPDDLDDAYKLKMFQNGSKYGCALSGVANYLRNMIKYSAHPDEQRELTKEEYDIVNKIYDQLFEIADNWDFDLWDINN